jgi:pimeloyl-ACP methyl ester carboxylesterase
LNEHSDTYLFARQIGAGEPVLILHGLLGSSDNWITVARKLAAFYTVFSLDLRNHGRSFQSDHFDYPAMADDVLAFIDQQDLKTVAIIGHSMGGKTAMQFAYLYPERLKKLVVVDIAPKAYPPHNLNAVDALLNLNLATISRLTQADEQLQPAIPDISERMSHLKNLKRGPDGTYYWQVNLSAIRKNYPFISNAVDDGSYTQSCLFIRGVNSDYIQDADWDDVLECFPRARLITLPNAGHWVHIQSREVFVNKVLDYLGVKLDAKEGSPR